jgi:hypothetical protein
MSQKYPIRLDVEEVATLNWVPERSLNVSKPPEIDHSKPIIGEEEEVWSGKG